MPISASKPRGLAATTPADSDAATSPVHSLATEMAVQAVKQDLQALRLAQRALISPADLVIQATKRDLQALRLAQRPLVPTLDPVVQAAKQDLQILQALRFQDSLARSAHEIACVAQKALRAATELPVREMLYAAQEASRITMAMPELPGEALVGRQILEGMAKAEQVLAAQFAAQDRAMARLMQATARYRWRTLADIQSEHRLASARLYPSRPSGRPELWSEVPGSLEIASSSIGIVVHQSSNVNINVNGTLAGRDVTNQGQIRDQLQPETDVEVIWVLQIGDLPEIIGSIMMPASFAPRQEEHYDLQGWPFALEFVMRGIRRVQVARIQRDYRLLRLPSGSWRAGDVTLTVYVQPVITLL